MDNIQDRRNSKKIIKNRPEKYLFKKSLDYSPPIFPVLSRGPKIQPTYEEKIIKLNDKEINIVDYDHLANDFSKNKKELICSINQIQLTLVNQPFFQCKMYSNRFTFEKLLEEFYCDKKIMNMRLYPEEYKDISNLYSKYWDKLKNKKYVFREKFSKCYSCKDYCSS